MRAEDQASDSKDDRNALSCASDSRFNSGVASGSHDSGASSIADSPAPSLHQHFWGGERKNQSGVHGMQYHNSASMLRQSGSLGHPDPSSSNTAQFDTKVDLASFLSNTWKRPNILRQTSRKRFRELLAFATCDKPEEVILPEIKKLPLVILTKPKVQLVDGVCKNVESDDGDSAKNDSDNPNRRYSSRQRRAPARLREVDDSKALDEQEQDDDDDAYELEARGVHHVRPHEWDSVGSSEDEPLPCSIRPTSRRKSPPMLHDMQQGFHHVHTMPTSNNSHKRGSALKRGRASDTQKIGVALEGGGGVRRTDDDEDAAKALAMLMGATKNTSSNDVSNQAENGGDCKQQ